MQARLASFAPFWAAMVAATIAAEGILGQRPAVLTGRVFADTVLRPIADVEVSIPALSRTVKSDAKGSFRIADIPPGAYRVHARRIGYAMFDATVEFKDGEIVERAIVLPRLTNLDTVVVVGESSLPWSFLEIGRLDSDTS